MEISAYGESAKEWRWISQRKAHAKKYKIYLLTFSTWFKEQIYGLLFDVISWDLYCWCLDYYIYNMVQILRASESQLKQISTEVNKEDSEQKPN